MRRIVLAVYLLAITFVSCSLQEADTALTGGVKTLTADRLDKLVEGGAPFIFLDVRTAREIEQEGTLTNYLHIPIDQLERRIDEVPRGKMIVVGCATGERSMRGAAILQEHGYQNVFAVGLKEYKAKGYPLIYPKLSG